MIWEDEAAVAVKFVGTDGGVVSGDAEVVAENVAEKLLRLPAASVARTRYEYEVEAANPLSLKVVVAGVAIWAKFEQPAPEQRSTL